MNRPRRVVTSLGLGAALGCAGCFGTPSPLAPGVQGSVGVPQSGVLTNGVELEARGPGFRRYRPRSPHYWGNPRLVTALREAAAQVDAAHPGGSPLYVGDIAPRRGGVIPGHRSHRTGRDVDLLFYLTTPSGAPIPSPGFVRLDSDGLGKVEGEEEDQYVRLDVERNWALVKTLMLSPHIGVQWLFASRGVEALLIDYARARGEDLELVWHAETVLLQPGDSSPHDDHFHLRIACSPEELVAGCEGGGPYWPWLPLPEVPPWLPDAELRALGRDDPLPLWEDATQAS
ncbi:MAG: penicillin-insensitive murein endopeptidase [Polyangiaceae bacterium]